MIKQNNNDQFNPTYEEILEEFNAAYSRLVLENIALKIRLSKVEVFCRQLQESSQTQTKDPDIF
jgi:glutathionylspermidine synthase